MPCTSAVTAQTYASHIRYTWAHDRSVAEAPPGTVPIRCCPIKDSRETRGAGYLHPRNTDGGQPDVHPAGRREPTRPLGGGAYSVLASRELAPCVRHLVRHALGTPACCSRCPQPPNSSIKKARSTLFEAFMQMLASLLGRRDSGRASATHREILALTSESRSPLTPIQFPHRTTFAARLK